MRSTLIAFQVRLAAILLAFPAGGLAQTNGDFEITTLPFPTGWIPTGTIAPVAAIGVTGTFSAQLEAGEGIHQDFAPSPADALATFDLRFAFRTSTLSNNDGNTAQNRIRIRGNNNATDIITLGFSSDAVRSFMGTWGDALTGITLAPGTTYHLRIMGQDLNLPTRSYTIGLSTDGVTYTTSPPSTRFHAGAGASFETVRFEGNGATFTVDDVTTGAPVLSDPPEIAWMVASPEHVTAGAPVTLTWSASAADTLALTPGGASLTAGSTSAVVTPATTTTYTLTATNPGGSTRKTFTVGVGGTPQPLKISEFMAANANGLADEDGDKSDWIELHNPNPWSINLGGLALTDEADLPDKWIFPPQGIAPGAYLLVFASGKGRAVAGQPLHTNFSLAAAGEYLALVDRAGYPLQSFAPAYAPQLDGVSTDGSGLFSTPTPGAANLPGPLLTAPGFVRQPDGAWKISVRTVDAASVTLFHRTMFLAEQPLVMVTGEDGWFTATLPATVAAPGQMLRWYFHAVDAANRTARLPAGLSTTAPQYLGTAVADPAVTSQLQVFEWFMDPAFTAAADTLTGARCSVFHLGEFYDNVLVHLRGATTASFHKKPHKFEFHDSEPFRFRAGLPRVDEINVNAAFSDGSYLRDYLAYRDLLAAGLPTPSVEPLRVQRNGAFHSVGVMIENVDSRFLRRHQLDETGPLFKATGNGSWLTGTTGFETRNGGVLTDLAAYANGIAPTNPNRAAYLFDHTNLPAVVNYLAAGVLGSIYNPQKNYYVFRNTRQGEWQVIAWDRDFAYGDIWLGGGDTRYPAGGPCPTIINNERIEHAASNEDRRGGLNRLCEAVMSVPAAREMFYRRLRTLLDGHFAPGNIESILDDWQLRLKPEADLDRMAWGYAPGPGGPYSFRPDPFDTAVNRIRKEYLPARRTYLLSNNTTPVNGLPASPTWMRGIVPAAQTSPPPIIIQSVETSPLSGNQDQEYIELKNPSSSAADLSGWTLAGGVSHSLAPGTVIPAGGSLFLTPDAVAFRARSLSPKGGESRFVQGNYTGHLSNFSEILTLSDPGGAVISTFLTPDLPSSIQRWLAISEIMYHPAPPHPDAEFIELHNTSPDLTLDLAGIAFTSGITFTFPAGFTLAPGARTVVVLNPAAFAAAWPGFTGSIAGTFTSGRLSNSGETLKLDDPTGSTVAEISYAAQFPWPTEADGGGASLTLIQPAATGSASPATSWRPSLASGGTPGATDATNWDGRQPQVSLQLPPDGPVVVLTYPLTADNVRFIPEISTDLNFWQRSGFAGQPILQTAPAGFRAAAWRLPPSGPHAYVRFSIESP